MKKKVDITYEGTCPSCGRYQSSKKPEDVDIECWKCEAAKGTIHYIKDIKGYTL